MRVRRPFLVRSVSSTCHCGEFCLAAILLIFTSLQRIVGVKECRVVVRVIGFRVM